ncbi:1000_t:CDS:1 [Cetraspora pellucida]|uniref:1000_t:CDS:1 n=1 Tax=Cetraspora pellucida TaxID=1433469 RepID=A0ACA9PKN7_9GLOM|nr:1000_t:CDS:1 [Cetraspora pellucida]
MSLLKKIINKIFKKQRYNIENNYWPDYKEINYSSESTNDNKDSLEPISTTEYEKQFSILYLYFYTKYEDFLEAVRNDKPEIYKQLKNWFGFFEAHARSWAHINTKGKKYIRNEFDQELSDY